MEAARVDLGAPETSAGLVLVADDDEDIRSLVALRLRKAGYGVVTAANGEEALRLAREVKPDLLLLDVSMPGMDGLAVCRELQASGGDAPVIFLTARTHDTAALEGFAAGAADYVTKPFRPAELLARVHANLRAKAVRDALAHDATTDPLTGLLNRRGLESRAVETVALARRHGRPLTCLAIDLDHFKRINDTYGHAAGDAVLRAVAERLHRQTRVSDLAARFGGEEFVLLLPETEGDGGAIVGEKVRAACAADPVAYASPEGHVSIPVTCSIGVACWRPGMGDPPDLFDEADRALYEAKRRGRNCVVLASGLR